MKSNTKIALTFVIFQSLLLGSYCSLQFFLRYFQVNSKDENSTMMGASYFLGVSEAMGCFGIFKHFKKPNPVDECAVNNTHGMELT